MMNLAGGEALRASGTSAAAVAAHYDVSDAFFRLWLGADLVYSCALWDSHDSGDTLDRAQRRKIDHFAGLLDVRDRRVLDIGSGWGALLRRFATVHRAGAGVGLTLSPAQYAHAAHHAGPGIEYRLESWVDHRPLASYDAITCIEMTEHLARDDMDEDAKVEVYRAFFERCASWLSPAGRFGLQLICLDNVGHDGSRPGRGPASELIRTAIFPESMPASLSELVLGWETHFRVVSFLEHTSHYRRTFRAWALAARAGETAARRLVGRETTRTFARYLAAGEIFFRLREHALYRVVLEKRERPKAWVVTPRPSAPDALPAATPLLGAPVAAVRAHYDISNEFYALWLGPTMMYSSGMWSGSAAAGGLEEAHARKLDWFARRVLRDGGTALDVGCGWGGALRRLAERHAMTAGVGLTLSDAQHAWVAANPVAGVDVRVEDWADHRPARPYDAIVSFGALEHFARDGTTGPERVARYRSFFARAHQWLAPGGRIGLEAIAHDDAPDTVTPLGRGPLGDIVLQLFPESICPHLGELVLGFEPWFEVEALRADADDFARTFRAWLLRLRDREAAAAALVGEPTTRLWRRYLAASEAQFRMGTITNVRLVLRRRAAPRR